MSTNIDLLVISVLLQQAIATQEKNREQFEELTTERNAKKAASAEATKQIEDKILKSKTLLSKGNFFAAKQRESIRQRPEARPYYHPLHQGEKSKFAVGWYEGFYDWYPGGTWINVFSTDQQAVASAEVPTNLPALYQSNNTTGNESKNFDMTLNDIPYVVPPGGVEGNQFWLRINYDDGGSWDSGLEEYYEALADPSNYSSGGYDITDRASSVQVSREENFVLPVGGKNAILVFWRKSQRVIRHYYKRTSQYKTNYYYAIATTRINDPFARQGVITYVSMVNFRTEKMSNGFSSCYDDPEEKAESGTCFVIGEKSARKIDTPPTLMTALANVYTDAVYTPSTLSDNTETGWYDGGYFTENWYGLDVFSTNLRFDVYETSYDAGIYKTLLEFREEFWYWNRWQSEEFMASEPIPKYMFGLCKLIDTCTTEKLGFDKIPDVFADELVWIKYPSADIITGPRAYGRYLMMGWDWDNPAYCKKKAVELGFKQEDFDPGPPPVV